MNHSKSILRRSNLFLHGPGSRGFALVITLSLMILLTVIAVGLLSLAQITLRSSSHSERQQVARQNARMSLQIALGELQRALGPDCRASIRSDLLASTPASPKVLGVVRTYPATPLNQPPADYLESLRTQGIADVQWLVSSKDKINPLTQSPQAGGNETVDIQSHLNASGAKEFIQAGKILTKSKTGNGNSGAFAWWIDDESQKASINVTAPETLAQGQPFKEHWKLTAAQQNPLHRVDSDPTTNYAPTAVTGYDPLDSATVRKLLDPLQADIAYSVGGDKNWFQKNQLDFTTYAKGLPIDVTSGRLKQDLGYYLETGNGLSNDAPVIRGGPGDATYQGPPLAGLNYNAEDMPRMGRIRTWKEIGATVTNFDTGGAKSRPKTKSDSGIAPVIARAGIYYAPYFDTNIQGPINQTINGNNYPAYGMDIRLAAYPRVTLWNPTSVPITDQWFLYQVAVTNHFMLVAKDPGSQGGSQSTGAAIDNNNVLWWRTFDPADQRKMMFHNMMNALAGLDKIDRAMPFLTFALKLDSPLLPGQSRTFYPSAANPLMNPYTPSKFKALRTSNANSANVMTNTPAPNNYFRVTDVAGALWGGRVWAKAAAGNLPMATRPSVPESLDTYLFVRQAESGANFDGSWTHGAGYRLWKLDSSAAPELLQEFFSAEHTGTGSATNGFPTYSISNAQRYDDPDDGVNAPGQSLVKTHSDPNQEPSSRRGHQIYLSYAMEDPKSDFNSVFEDSSRQFAPFLHYNPRSRYIFPGTYEENKTGTGTAGVFAPAIHGVRQELYSEGRPEAAWLNDWPVDSYQSSEDGYGAAGDYGTASLFDLNLNSNGLVAPLYDFPRADDGVLSLGDLQAVDFATYPWQPGNAFGNSRADPRIPRKDFTASIAQTEDHFHIKNLNLGTNRYIDLSWLLNHSLWDRFFVSTVPYADSSFTASPGKTLRNARHQIVPGKDKVDIDPATAFEDAAAHIEVSGAFNVNSTSVAAWKQFLSSNMNRTTDVNTGGGNSSPADQAAFPRILYPYRAEPDEGDRNVGGLEGTKAAFSANRSLTDAELQKLAEKTVEEVKKRGPFLSIADFVNRRLVDKSNNKYGEWAGLSGTLQTAIDRVTVEDQKINHHLLAESDLAFTNGKVPPYLEQSHVVGLPDGKQQSRLAGAPGALSQADVLRAVGPMLTVRGDTFRIRAYGEARNPATGAVEAKAWCEAVVQRKATPVDPADNLIAPDKADPFGRRFELISFRWLHPNEI